MYPFTSEFIKHIQQARHALQIQFGQQLSKDFFDVCMPMAEAGIVIEIYLDNRHVTFLEQNPYALNACLQLIVKGACVFSTSANQQVATSFIIDFNTYGWCTIDEVYVPSEQSIESMEFQRMEMLFEALKQQSKPYLIRKGDIQIEYTLSNDTILLGDTFELIWQVKKATKIIIQGIGETNAFGRAQIKPEKDTIIKIGAYNNQQAQLKAFIVRVADFQKNIQYDIGFINERTKEYTSLVNSALHPHVYGLSKGHLIRLQWHVSKANHVHVHPFNSEEASGTIEFTPTESMAIEIQTVFNATTFVRNIQILLFPIPLLSNPIIPIEKLTQIRFSLPIPNDSAAYKNAIKHIEQERYKALNNTLDEYAKSLRTSDRTILQLTKNVFARLKNIYTSRTEIVEELKSIESYYDHKHSSNGINE